MSVLPQMHATREWRRFQSPLSGQNTAPLQSTDRPLRVAIATNSITYGGVEEHVILLSRTLIAHGCAVTVFSDETLELKVLNDRLDRFGVPREVEQFQISGGREKIRAALRVASKFRALNIDVLHLHLIGYDGGRIPLMAARIARIPTVVTHHIAPLAPVSLKARLVRAPFTSGVKAFVAVSEANRRAQVRNMRLPEQRAVCVHNGINGDCAAPCKDAARDELRAELGLEAGTPIIGCVGRLAEQKGHHWLLQAMPQILERIPNARLVCIGDGPLRAELEDLTARLGLEDRVHWMGFRTDGQKLLNGIDVLAMPSRYEGLPIVLLEAMSSGIPVVAHSVDGIPEAIRHETDGLLIEVGDVASLASGLIRLLEDPAGARAMGRNAQRRIQEQFTADVMADKLVTIYRSAAGHHEHRLAAA